MTKADKIRDLYKLGWSRKEITAEIGCHPNYVRVAVHQRKGGRQSQSDKNYRPRANSLARRRYRTDPDVRERQLARMRRRYRARKAGQEARA